MTSSKLPPISCSTLHPLNTGEINAPVASTLKWSLALSEPHHASFINELLWLCPHVISVTWILNPAKDIEEPIGFDVYLPNEASHKEALDTFNVLAREHAMSAFVSSNIPEPIYDEDWANHWKAFWKPQRILPNLVIKPTWEALPQGEVTAEDIIIDIDPGMAFGTGTHETTQLVLYLIDSYLNRRDGYRDGIKSAIDVGTGSGILAFYLAKLGLESIDAIDNDATAIDVAKDNASINDLPVNTTQTLTFETATLEEWQARYPQARYDLVIANIILPVILPALPALVSAMAPNGLLFLSGIVKTQWPQIRDALKEHPELWLRNLVQQGDWLGVVCQKRDV
jgi:ribosomal protein L11 methyltransferase